MNLTPIALSLFVALLLVLAFLLGLIGGRRSSRKVANTDKRYEELRNIFHDLRTPVTLIQGYLETLESKRTEMSEEEALRAIRIARKNCELIGRLTTDFLDLAHLEQNVSSVLAPVNISELAIDLAERFQQFAEEKKLTLKLSLPQKPLTVLGDSRHLERVLMNLLRNAIYYTPSGGKVVLEMKQAPEVVEISISDTGIGIPATDLPQLGKPFFRVNRDRSRKSGGTGLGLAISSRILQAHRSALRFESKPGQGTKVSFSLVSA